MDIFDALTALGGLCLFLFGMQIMAEALQRRAGGRLEGLLRRMTRSRWAGFFTGLAVTAAVQSSSAAMVMVVGFVNSGMLTLRQAVGVIMGTNVGTTVTPWLLSLGGLEGGGVLGRLLRPAGFVPLLSLWGIAAYLAGKGSRRDTGQALLGFAVLMQGMEIMTAAVSGLARAEGFRQLFTAFGSPLLGVLAGAVLTAVIQSSSASVGILQALAASGQVTVGAAIPIVMGQNIGTCVTAMLSSVGASRSARRAALVHLLFNLAGAGIWLGVFWLVKALAAPAILDRAVTLPGVAVIHTAFNLLCTAALFPAAGLLERAVLRLLPGEETPSAEPDPRLLAAPAAALERCRELTLEMADLARDNLRRGIQALTEVHPDSARELRRQEERIDGLEDALGTFLVRLGGRTLTRRDSARAAELLMKSRETVARCLNCQPREIIFTSGGSEADNQALLSAAAIGRRKGKMHIISTAFEHHAILHTLKKLEKEGFQVELLPVHENGMVSARQVADAIREDTCLVTVMYANNEIGSILPIEEIGAVCREKGSTPTPFRRRATCPSTSRPSTLIC